MENTAVNFISGVSTLGLTVASNDDQDHDDGDDDDDGHDDGDGHDDDDGSEHDDNDDVDNCPWICHTEVDHRIWFLRMMTIGDDNHSENYVNFDGGDDNFAKIITKTFGQEAGRAHHHM